MQTTTSFGGNMIGLGILGILETAIVLVNLTRVSMPIIGNNRITLIVFLVLGMAMCTMGMQITEYGWTNLFNIVGIVIGVAILVIGIAASFGVQLPFVADERAAILVIAALMIFKLVVGGVRGVVA